MLDQRLHTFLVLCDTMNYTRAAERLCITQPAVTHHIHFLEEHYGNRLFSYEGKTLHLTKAGLRLRELARSLAYNCDKVEECMANPAAMSLRVGATKTIGEYVIAPQVQRFLHKHPDARFSLLVENTQILLRELEGGRLDFALVEGFFDQEKYAAKMYRQEAFLGVCAPTHRFAGRAVPFEELMQERLIVREEGSGTRAVFEQALHRRSRTLRSFSNLACISDFSMIKALVRDGMGVSFLYAAAVERELAAGTLAQFTLEGENLSGAFHFVCLKDNQFADTWSDWIE